MVQKLSKKSERFVHNQANLSYNPPASEASREVAKFISSYVYCVYDFIKGQRYNLWPFWLQSRLILWVKLKYYTVNDLSLFI